MTDAGVIRTARAPGKLVVMGEYAVVDGPRTGAEAVVAAVDVVAVASHDPSAQDDIAFDDAGLVRAVLDDALAVDGHPDPGGSLVVDTSAFRDPAGRKLGLGSSAAVAASLVALLRPDLDVDAQHRLTQRAHRRFQRGRGSGIDVAASVYGAAGHGLVRFHRRSDVDDDVAATPMFLDWQALGISPLVVFVGSSQDTRAAVQKVQATDATMGPKAAMAEATRAFLAAVEVADRPGMLESVRAGAEAMRAIGHAVDVDVVSAPHQLVIAHAARFGGAAKPSGAGVGDVALAFIPTDAVDAFWATLPAPLSRVDLVVGQAQPGVSPPARIG